MFVYSPLRKLIEKNHSYLNDAGDHGLERLFYESHWADAEEDVLQEPGRARVSVGGRQHDVLEPVRVAELGRQPGNDL